MNFSSLTCGELCEYIHVLWDFKAYKRSLIGEVSAEDKRWGQGWSVSLIPLILHLLMGLEWRKESSCTLTPLVMSIRTIHWGFKLWCGLMLIPWAAWHRWLVAGQRVSAWKIEHWNNFDYQDDFTLKYTLMGDGHYASSVDGRSTHSLTVLAAHRVITLAN